MERWRVPHRWKKDRFEAWSVVLEYQEFSEALGLVYQQS
jgi:hypothetical protein